jgi:polysaccharide biosynthesis/export protein
VATAPMDTLLRHVLLQEVVGLPPEAPRMDGEYLVRLDGTLSLGNYGSVSVAGRSLEQIREAVAGHLARHVSDAKLGVLVAVAAYNSKTFYIIAKREDGEQVYRFPDMGGETVVGAVLRVDRLASRALKGRVWLARPSGAVLEVDWNAITQQGKSDTNYLLHSGDRVYVESPLPK